MVSPKKSDRHLLLRGTTWHYQRRVPKRFQRFDPRRFVRETLNTESLELARLRRDELARADDEYWASLAMADAAVGEGGPGAAKVARQHYAAAKAQALAMGFTYKPMATLLRDPDPDEIARRMLALRPAIDSDAPSAAFKADAVLGAVEAPRPTVSEALEIYFDEIAIDEQYNKSDRQKYQWRKVKRLSIAYFVEVVGDMPLTDITRDHAQKFHRFWTDRMLKPKKGEQAVTPNTANRHLGNVRVLYTSYFRHIGEEDRANPFRNMFFKGKTRAEVLAFDDAFVRDNILLPGMFSGLRPDLQLAVYMLIETGCRPSEIINLQPEDIRLDEEVPFIAIKPRRKREIKTESSIREIPLVGVSLEAAKRAPSGFPHYHDRNELFSASVMKAFKSRGLLPTPAHRVYSFRHAFEKRMQEANIDYGLRCLLMGHRTDRPAYGDGGSLAYRRDELMKIVHPYDERLFGEFDRSVS
ncbi:site-specific integrase [Parvularcula oceani]|uniref:site-specific integrase n=1 Tax=Parvularcula oceani TaxID=1247963 RepID=UPI0004E18BAE|nr:site-specific integrase [Parvularcula oceani]